MHCRLCNHTLLSHGLVLHFPCATTAISYDAEPVPILLKVEVAFREQTAGHNALLLLVSLSHELLEARLRNAFLDVHARQAEVRPCSLACIVCCKLQRTKTSRCFRLAPLPASSHAINLQ